VACWCGAAAARCGKISMRAISAAATLSSRRNFSAMLMAGCVLPQQGKLLQPDRIGFDLPRLAPFLEQFCDVERTGSVEDVQKPLMMLERIGRRIEIRLLPEGPRADRCGSTDRYEAVFVHGAEIRLEAAGERAAMHSAIVVLEESSFMRWHAAAAVPKMPSVAVGCQPLS